MFSTDELNHLPYGEKKIVLVTCHRRENYGEPMKNIMLALRQIAEENPRGGAGVSRSTSARWCGKRWTPISGARPGCT